MNLLPKELKKLVLFYIPYPEVLTNCQLITDRFFWPERFNFHFGAWDYYNSTQYSELNTVKKYIRALAYHGVAVLGDDEFPGSNFILGIPEIFRHALANKDSKLLDYAFKLVIDVQFSGNIILLYGTPEVLERYLKLFPYYVPNWIYFTYFVLKYNLDNQWTRELKAEEGRSLFQTTPMIITKIIAGKISKNNSSESVVASILTNDIPWLKKHNYNNSMLVDVYVAKSSPEIFSIIYNNIKDKKEYLEGVLSLTNYGEPLFHYILANYHLDFDVTQILLNKFLFDLAGMVEIFLHSNKKIGQEFYNIGNSPIITDFTQTYLK